MSASNLTVVSANSEAPRMLSIAGIEYSVETVTPATAKKWLAMNTDNRKFRRNRAETYARDIEAGKWQENGEAIRFAKDGTLLDGQHRLWAVVHANRAITVLVVRGLSNSAQDTMDDLAKRTLGDTFNFHNVTGPNRAAAIVRRVLMWQEGFKSNVGGFQPSKAEALTALREDHTLNVAIEAASNMRQRRLVPPTIIGLTYWIFWNIDQEDCSTFWHALHTGEALTADSPIYIVREQIQRHMQREGRVAESSILAWIIKAWNHYRAGKTLAPTYTYKLKPSERIPEAK